MSAPSRPSSDFPIGSKVTLLDAWLRNPREVRITKHYPNDHILSECDRGIIHYAHTGRIVGEPRGRWVSACVDLLGDPLPRPASKPDISIEDLLG